MSFQRKDPDRTFISWEEEELKDGLRTVRRGRSPKGASLARSQKNSARAQKGGSEKCFPEELRKTFPGDAGKMSLTINSEIERRGRHKRKTLAIPRNYKRERGNSVSLVY